MATPTPTSAADSEPSTTDSRIGMGNVVMGGNFRAGETVWGQYTDPCGDTFYEATVQSVEEDGACFLRWKGFGSQFDALTPANCAAKMTPQNNIRVRVVVEAHERLIEEMNARELRQAAKPKSARARPLKRKRDDSFIVENGEPGDSDSDEAATASAVAVKPRKRRPPPSTKRSRKLSGTRLAADSSSARRRAAGSASVSARAASDSRKPPPQRAPSRAIRSSTPLKVTARAHTKKPSGRASPSSPSRFPGSKAVLRRAPVEVPMTDEVGEEIVDYLTLWPGAARIRLVRDEKLMHKKCYHVLPATATQSVSYVLSRYCVWWEEKAQYHFSPTLGRSNAQEFATGTLIKLNPHLDAYLAPHEKDQLRVIRRKNLIPPGQPLCEVYPVDILLRFCVRLADALRSKRVLLDDPDSRVLVNTHLCLLPQFLAENADAFQLANLRYAPDRSKSVPAAPPTPS